MAFNYSEYESVSDRITKFWDKYPTGRIHTEIVLINEIQVVVKASVWRDIAETMASTIDFAQETIGSSHINKGSFLENCATSAIGRALADLGFSPKGKRPSIEEMITAWVGQARAAHEAGNINVLRNIYAEADKGGAPADTLKQIADLAETLKTE
jgi:hypothetical protein